MSKFFTFLLSLCIALPITALPHSYDDSKRDIPYFTGTSSTPANPDFLRGVNIGGWLILEKWMTPDLFTGPFADATDQWTFDSTPGATEALQTHWSTYFTEADAWTIKSYGFNASASLLPPIRQPVSLLTQQSKQPPHPNWLLGLQQR